MHGYVRLTLVAACVLLADALGSGPVTLVRDGEPTAAICTGENPSEKLEQAAGELQTYLRKMSGADVPVVEKPEPGRSVVLLGARALEAAGVAVDLSGLGPEGGLLRTLSEGRLIAAGRTDLGAVNAAYDLLDLLGVRWFMPGEFGEHVPELSTVTVPALDRTFEPTFAHRRIWAASNRLPAKERDEYHAWQRRNRMPGWLTGSMGHAYAKIVSPRDPGLFEQHPEYFSLMSGKRAQHSQICTTNPEVRDRALRYARDLLAQRPAPMMVSFSPNDGRRWCECASCAGEGSSTDNALALANHAADMLAKEFPDRFVAMYAYAPTSPPPSIAARENVIIWIADGFIAKGWTTKALIEAWSKQAHHIGIRDYYSVNPWSWQAPRHDPHGLAEELRYYHSHKALGISAESEVNFGSRGVNYWVAARLQVDLTQSVAELLDDYFGKAYGPAASALRSYWERWGAGQGVSSDRIALALRDLRRADELAAGNEKVLARVRALKTYLHYMRLFREYTSTKGPQAFEPFVKMITYGFGAIRYHQVGVTNVMSRLAIKGGGKRFDVDLPTIRGWRATPPIPVARLEADFAEDLAAFKPLGLARLGFSRDLAPLSTGVTGAAAAPAYRGRGNIVHVLVPDDGAVALEVTTGLVRPWETVLTLETPEGRKLDEAVVPAGVTQKIQVDHGGPKPDVLALAGAPKDARLRASAPGLAVLRTAAMPAVLAPRASRNFLRFMALSPQPPVRP